MKNLRVKSIRIVGVVPSFPFQRAKAFVLELHRSMPSRFPVPEIEGLLELEWFERLTEWRRMRGSDFWRLKRPVAVFLDDKFIGSDIELLKLTCLGNIFVESVPKKDALLMKRSFQKDYLARLRDNQLIYCYLDICVDDAFIGTLVFQLYSDILPQTCENFTNLCLGTKGSLFSYKGTRIHRIVKDMWLQGGDIQKKTGADGCHAYLSPLEDECFGISHDRRGVLSIAKDAKESNETQFLITFSPCKWIDNCFVAFGQLIEGVKVLNILENLNTFQECPLKKVEIKNCGRLNLDDTEYVQDKEKKKFKKKRKIETIADQVVRLVMEAVTACLAMKEHAEDVIHTGDVPSVMSLDMFFQGFYSLPEEVLEDSAKYIRSHRREFFRHVRPSATEVVEVITFDILTAVLAKLVDLDDVRQALTFPVYNKLLNGINMEVEMLEKPYVRNFVDQLVDTAEKMLKVLSRHLMWLRRKSAKTRAFQDQMNEWLKSFVLQETFADDNFRIAERGMPPKPKKSEDVDPCAEGKKKKKMSQKKQTDAELCCDGEPSSEDEPTLSDYFSKCMYELKTVKRDRGTRMPILDLIECGRYQLKLLRHHEHRYRPKARICLEKLINRWMKDVVYTSETDWVRQTVFAKDDVCFSHTEEILYGAMTVGLLEIYFLMEAYLKQPRRKKYITRVVYSDSSESAAVSLLEQHLSFGTHSDRSDGSQAKDEKEREIERMKDGSVISGDQRSQRSEHSTKSRVASEGRPSGGEDKSQGRFSRTLDKKPCLCGDICCDCTSAPGDQESGSIPQPPTPPPTPASTPGPTPLPSKISIEGESRILSDVVSGEEQVPPEVLPEYGEVGSSVVPSEEGEEGKEPPPAPSKESSCYSEPEEVDIDDILAQVMGGKDEKINIKSFFWMRNYIEEKGCEFKSRFARQVHNWLEHEIFSYNGFLSKHSLVTRASLLSFSLSIASLLKEENALKTELKDFFYDLWVLYFREMIKETLLEHPQTVSSEKISESESGNAICLDPCGRVKALARKNFDFDEFCRMIDSQEKEKSEVLSPSVEEQEGELQAEEPITVLEGEGMKEDEKSMGVEKFVGEGGNEELEIGEEVGEQEELEVQYKATAMDEPETKEEANEEEKPQEKETNLEEEVEILEEVEVKGETEKETIVFADELPGEMDTKFTSDHKEESVVELPESTQKKRVPKLVRELVVSSEEIRPIKPYTLPFWVLFLAQITKRAMNLIAKSSRLPRRLYFGTDSKISLDEKMKEWTEFNNIGAPNIGMTDLKDFITGYHVDVDNVEESARSFLRKQRISQLMEKSSRTTAAELVAEDLILDVQMRTMEKMGGRSGNLPYDIMHDLIAAATIQSPETFEAIEEGMFGAETDTELSGEWGEYR